VPLADAAPEVVPVAVAAPLTVAALEALSEAVAVPLAEVAPEAVPVAVAAPLAVASREGERGAVGDALPLRDGKGGGLPLAEEEAQPEAELGREGAPLAEPELERERGGDAAPLAEPVPEAEGEGEPRSLAEVEGERAAEGDAVDVVEPLDDRAPLRDAEARSLRVGAALADAEGVGMMTVMGLRHEEAGGITVL